MRQFSIAVEIAASPERVWAVMSDIERWHEWTTSVRGIWKLGSAPLAVGTRAIIRQPKFPPALWRVVELERGRHFVWVSKGPGFGVTARHAVEPAGSGARAMLSLEFTGPLGAWFGRRTQRINNAYLALEAAGLKRRSESLE